MNLNVTPFYNNMRHSVYTTTVCGAKWVRVLYTLTFAVHLLATTINMITNKIKVKMLYLDSKSVTCPITYNITATWFTLNGYPEKVNQNF